MARKIAKKARKPKAPPALPSRDELRAFVRTQTGRVGKREITRHFNLPSEMRPALRAMLAELAR